jgi:hypothetical protein
VIECGFAFMGIEYYTVMFMWLWYPNMYLYIDLRDLSILTITCEHKYELPSDYQQSHWL